MQGQDEDYDRIGLAASHWDHPDHTESYNVLHITPEKHAKMVEGGIAGAAKLALYQYIAKNRAYCRYSAIRAWASAGKPDTPRVYAAAHLRELLDEMEDAGILDAEELE